MFALLAGLIALLLAVLVIGFVLRLARQPGARVNLGTSEFELGKADVFARAIAKSGPLRFQRLRSGAPDIFVQHLGGDDTRGWVAFATTAVGEPRKCQLVWGTDQQFSDPCSHKTYPADGTGLTQYAARVDPAGKVFVNLRQPLAAPSGQ